MDDEVGLRDAVREDIEIFFQQEQDPEAAERANFPSRDHATFVRHWERVVMADPENRAMAVTVGDAVAGNFCAWWQGGRRTVGYWLGRSFWGRGVGTAGMALFLRAEPARPLWAEVAAGNEPSLRLLRKSGFLEVDRVSDEHGEFVVLRLDDRFESHLTLAATSADDQLRALVRGEDAKYTRILLDRGAHPDQPMVTVRGRGTVSDQHELVAVWTRRLADAGFEVTRVKIEASPDNSGIPQSDEFSGDGYFEHHIKVTLGDLDAVRAVAERHGAHVSRNARRTHDDGTSERFVTQRCHDVGQPTARHRLAALVLDLAEAGYEPLEVEQEYVVSDSNLALDKGWIEE